MGRIADVELPEAGEVAETVLPETTTVTPEQADIQASRLTATPLQKGVRGGFNQLGAMTSAFVSTAAGAMGLTQFAAERMKDAEQQAAFAEAVSPEVRDFRAVKDGADAAEFFLGTLGQSVATTVPALAGAAAGRFGAGVRGAYAGGFAGSFVPNAGEQALRVRGESMNPQERLGHVAATGGAAAAMDALLPAMAVNRVARPVRGAGLGGSVAKAAGVEGLTEGSQELLGQAMHTSVAPRRDKSRDDEAVVDSMVSGAIGGGGIGLGTRVAEAGSGLVQDGLAKLREMRAARASKEQTADDVKRELSVEDAPVDETDVSDMFDRDDLETPEQMVEYLKGKGEAAASSLAKVWERVKGDPLYAKFEKFREDPDVREEFYKAARARYEKLEVEPRVKRALDSAKAYTEGLRKGLTGKQSRQRTKLDFEIHDNMLRHLDSGLARSMTPEQKLEAAEYLKHAAMYDLGKRDEVAGPGRPAYSADEKGAVREQDRATVARRLPADMLKLFGKQAAAALNSTNELLLKGGVVKQATDFTPHVQASEQHEQRKTTAFEDLIRSNLADDVAANPEAREQAAKVLAPRLIDIVSKGMSLRTQKRGGKVYKQPDAEHARWQAFDREMEYAFGNRKDAVIEALEGMQQRIASRPDDFWADEEKVTAEEIDKSMEVFDVDTGEMRPATEEDFEAIRREQNSPLRDTRVGTPIRGLAATKSAFQALQREYDRKRVQFVVKQLEDGRYSIEARDRLAEDVLSEQEWEAIREMKREDEKSYNRSGLDKGIITVQMLQEEKYTDENGNPAVRYVDKGNKQNKINLIRLTREMMRTTPRQDTGNVKYIYDMVSRGLSRLLADPRVKGLNEATQAQVEEGAQSWDLPDDTPVAVWGREPIPGKPGQTRPRVWRWGEVKEEIRVSPEKLRMNRITSNALEAAQQAASIKEIEETVEPFLKERIEAVDSDITEAKEYAIAQTKLHGKGTKQSKEAWREFFRLKYVANRLKTAMAQVADEIDRRELDGDAPMGEVKGMVSTEDTFKTGGLASENPKGARPRVVEGDTGLPLHGGNLAGGAKTTPSKPGVYKASLTRGGKGLEEGRTDKVDPKTGRAPTTRKARADTMVKLRAVPGDLKKTLKKEARAAKKAAKGPKSDKTVDVMARALELVGEARLRRLVEEEMAEIRGKGVEPNEASITEMWARKIAYGEVVLKPEALDPTRDSFVANEVQDLAKDVREIIEKLKREGKLSTMNVGREGSITKEEAEAVRAYVAHVLGPQAKVFFKNMDAAGSFVKMDGVEVLKVAVDAMDPAGVARHEAAHALIARLLKTDRKAAQTLLAAAGSPTVVSRLRTLLKGHPGALQQLSDAEERLAYMYQFWGAGQLKVGPNTEGQFERIRSFFRKIAAFWSETSTDLMNVERAEAIFDLFERGDLANPNTVREVLHDKLPKTAFEKATELAGPAYKFLDKAISTADGYVRSMNVAAFNKAMDLFYSPAGSEAGPGYIQTRYVELNKRLNALEQVVAGASQEDQRLALEALQTRTEAKSERAKQIVTGIRGILAEVFEYMQKSGVKAVVWNESAKKYDEVDVGFVPDYFPRYFNRQAVSNDRKGFEDALVKAGNSKAFAKEVADSILRSTKQNPDENDFSAGLTFYAPNTMARKLDVDDKVVAPWLMKDLYGSMVSYLTYTTRRAEYAKRFGNQGQEIEKTIAQAVREGASPEQVKTFSQAVMALEGSLGHDIKPELKRLMGGVLTYQNFRLLPLALFSSLVDPTGIVVRGGTLGDAFGAFVRSVTGLVKETKDDHAFKLAELVGAIATNNDAHMLADAYGSQYMTEWQRNLNTKFFKYNGMESWNRSMRVAATGAAERFIIRHATKPNEHSERFLRELGLTKEDVRLDADGHLDVTEDKMQKAITQWVDGAVLRPNAAIRPIWMSDPHWMLIAHLKQFTYSFQKTIISRVVHELENGNVTPAFALLSYVPLIIGADLLRALLTPGGGDDSALERLGLGGIVWRGVQRAGVFGPGQYALDAYGDLGHGKLPVSSILGPSAQQLLDFGYATASPQGDLGKEALKALPGYMLVR